MAKLVIEFSQYYNMNNGRVYVYAKSLSSFQFSHNVLSCKCAHALRELFKFDDLGTLLSLKITYQQKAILSYINFVKVHYIAETIQIDIYYIMKY